MFNFLLTSGTANEDEPVQLAPEFYVVQTRAWEREGRC